MIYVYSCISVLIQLMKERIYEQLTLVIKSRDKCATKMSREASSKKNVKERPIHKLKWLRLC
jgi:hypothetical protein